MVRQPQGICFGQLILDSTNSPQPDALATFEGHKKLVSLGVGPMEFMVAVDPFHGEKEQTRAKKNRAAPIWG